MWCLKAASLQGGISHCHTDSILDSVLSTLGPAVLMALGCDIGSVTYMSLWDTL